MRKVMFGALALSVLITGQSFAATIDFRKPIWNPNGDEAKTVGNTTVIALNGSQDATLFWATDDGFGVNGGKNDREQDEINNGEELVIAFAQTFLLQSFTLTDLFAHESIDGGRTFFDEQAQFRLNGGAWETISGFERPGVSNGEFTLGFLDNVFVNLIEFRAAPGGFFDPHGLRNDFSVAAISGSAVPEPTSMLLLGTGLVGLATRLRRK